MQQVQAAEVFRCGEPPLLQKLRGQKTRKEESDKIAEEQVFDCLS
jgi:hypothetical protein